MLYSPKNKTIDKLQLSFAVYIFVFFFFFLRFALRLSHIQEIDRKLHMYAEETK